MAFAVVLKRSGEAAISAICRRSSKQVFLEISQYSRENTGVGVFFYRTHPVAASVSAKTKYSKKVYISMQFFLIKK